MTVTLPRSLARTSALDDFKAFADSITPQVDEFQNLIVPSTPSPTPAAAEPIAAVAPPTVAPAAGAGPAQDFLSNPLGNPSPLAQPGTGVQSLPSTVRSITPTTTEISGGGRSDGTQDMLTRFSSYAARFGDEGRKALAAVLVTEGGMTGSVGDTDRSTIGSHGPLQFYGSGGQLNNFAKAHGMSVETAGEYVRKNPDYAVQWALDPNLPGGGYMARAIETGLKQGLTGAALATFIQRTGQVSESPERAGANWMALFGNGASLPSVAVGAPTGPSAASSTPMGRTAIDGPGSAVDQFRRFADDLDSSTRSLMNGMQAGATSAVDEFRKFADSITPKIDQVLDTRPGDAPAFTLPGAMDRVGRATEPARQAIGDTLGGIGSQLDAEGTSTVLGAGKAVAGAYGGQAARDFGAVNQFRQENFPSILEPGWMNSLERTPEGRAISEKQKRGEPLTPEEQRKVKDAEFDDVLMIGGTAGISGVGNAVTKAALKSLGQGARPAAPAAAAAFDDAEKILIQRQAVASGAARPNPTPDDVDSVLNTLSLGVQEQLADRRVRLKAIETYLEKQRGAPLGWDEKVWMRARVYEGRQDVALARLEREISPALKEVGPKGAINVDAFLEQMDNIDKAASIGRRVEQQVMGQSLGRIAGTAAAEQAEKTLSRAKSQLSQLQKLEAAGTAPGAARVQQATDRMTRLQQHLDELTATTAQRQAERVGREAVDEVGKMPLRLSLRDAEQSLNQAKRQYANALETGDPAKLRATLRSLDQAEWRYMQADEAAQAAGSARAERITDRATTQIEDIGANGPRETPAMARASKDVQYAQKALERAKANVDARGSVTQAEAVKRAEDYLAKAQGKQAAALKAAEDARAARATTEGAAAQAGRQFSGGARAQDEAAVREAWEARLGPAEAAKVFKAADAVWGTVGTLRERMVSSGVWSREQADFFAQNFPHYVRTNILDKLSDSAIDSLPKGGRTFTVGSNGIKALSEAGTTKARQSPLSAVVDMSFRMEELAQKNEIMRTVANWADDPAMTNFVKRLTADEAVPRGYKPMSVFLNGEKERLAVVDEAFEAMGLGTPQATGVLGVLLAAGRLPLQMGATALRPSFIASNMANDLLWSLYRFAVEAPNPSEGVRAVTDMMRGYKAAFGGDAALVQRAREAGGSIGIKSRFDTPDVLVRQLAGEHVWVRPIRNTGDMRTLLKDSWGATTDVAGLLWSRPLNVLGSRVEDAPRLAAFARAERQGANATEAAMKKRTATVDFAAGGMLTKQLNQLIPFINATSQASTEFVSLVKNRPAQATAAMATILGGIITTEIYNRAIAPDDYADVSKFTKDTGLVVMSDKAPEGDGKRGLVYIPLRGGIGMLVPLVRAAMGAMYGDNPRTWQELARRTIGALSPVEPDASGAIGAFVPPLPALAGELAANYDSFRDQPIVPTSKQALPVTEQYDERTSQTARLLSRSDVPGFSQKPPMAIDYGVKGFSPGPAEALLGVTDMLIRATGNALPEAPKKGVPGARDIPIIGGVAGRFLKTAGSERQNQQYDQAEALAAKNRRLVLDALQDSPTFKNATPDRQQQLLRTLEQELEDQAREMMGIEPKPRELGLPNKYVGVSDPKKAQDIDDALAKWRAWEKDPKQPKPTGAELKLALAYEDLVNPKYTAALKAQQAQGAEVRRMVDKTMAGNR